MYQLWVMTLKLLHSRFQILSMRVRVPEGTGGWRLRCGPLEERGCRRVPGTGVWKADPVVSESDKVYRFSDDDSEVYLERVLNIPPPKHVPASVYISVMNDPT